MLPSYTLPEASELTGLPIEELPQGPARYTELGFGEPHERILPYGLKGVGTISHDHPTQTETDRAMVRLVEYLRTNSTRTHAIDELANASGLKTATTQTGLSALQAVGLVKKHKAPKYSGKRILVSWAGDDAA